MKPFEQVQLALYNRLKDVDTKTAEITPVLMASWLREDIPELANWPEQELAVLALTAIQVTQ